jgi:uncharacterized protein with ParB-like and HNH nuclease domain/predicted transport protein
MDAHDVRLTEMIDGQKQYIVPVFQRDYSWGTKQCLQLWQDIIRIGKDKNAKGHFIGSVVYIEAEETSASITRWLLIDGQQRLTTLLLIFAALRRRMREGDETDLASETGDLPTAEAIEDSYLINRHVRGERRYKLHLRRTDHETLTALLDDKPLPGSPSERIAGNFAFFDDAMKEADPFLVYRGLRKLVAVDVHLTRGQDDPQMIFESLNSTGLDLTQADLIRNFVLMRQSEEQQTSLYENYWRPIEIAFGTKYRTEFDKFIRDYLTIKLKPSKQFKSEEIYQQFRAFFQTNTAEQPVEALLDELKRFSTYYVGFSLGQEPDARLGEALKRLRTLVEVASPLMLQLYDCYSRTRTLDLAAFLEAIATIESYVFRRAVCDMQTRSLYQIFASLAYYVRANAPLDSLKAGLYRQGRKRRYPTDTEFREALESRDVYDTRTCFYLLDRLENDSKEKIDTANLTIEHVLPQNEELKAEWKEMLGQNWREIQETWQHRLGNLTLTGYNAEYSDLPFDKKKTLLDKEGRPVGFDFSPLRLNRFIREQDVWTQEEIEKRGKQLANRAIKIWPPLSVEMSVVRAAEIEELKANAQRFKIDDLEFGPETRALFDELRKQICALGTDIIELAGANTVTYRVFDFFVEVIPRRRYLTLNLNLDFEEAEDPTERAIDATEQAFIVHATETGGVLFRVREAGHVAPALHLIRQAYEKASE